ncbi:MAG: PAS domain S-box protein [Desulfobacteraceae bacterium]|nr:PAS domain S-box protein [Desulfobacteraceae bacterium]
MKDFSENSDTATAAPMTKDICCRNFKGLLAYVRHHYGERGIRELTDGLLDGSHCVQDPFDPGRIVPISEEHLMDSACWVSNEFSLALLANVNRVVRTTAPLFTAGCAMVQEDLSRSDLFMAKVAGIEKLSRRAAKVNARFNNTKDVHLLALEPERALFELRYRPGFRVTKDVCDWNLGIYVGIARLAGVADTTGREVACVLEGDPHCQFEITWKRRNLFARLWQMAARGLFRFGTRDLVNDYEKTIEERDRLIDRLTRSEEKYRRLFENALDPMSLSRDGRLIDVNRAWLDLHDFSRKSEVAGRDVLDFIHPDDRPVLSTRRALWPRQSDRLVQVRDVTRNGQSRTVEVYSTCIEIGGRESILATLHDVTASKETEAELRGIEEQLRIFIENTPAPVAVCDRDMRYLAYSRRWIEDYHLPTENLLGRCHYDIFASIPEKWKKEHQRCFAGEVIENEEEPFQRADGSMDWVRRKVYPWRNSRGRIGGLIMFTEVITARKLAESALRESEEKYRKLVENAMDAIFIAQDETIKFPNPKTLEFLGLSEEPNQPIPLVRYLHPDDRAKVLDRHHQRLTGKKNLPTEYTIRILNRLGTEFTMQLNVVPIEWERRPAVLCFMRDITEQKRIAESLRQSQKFEAIGTLAGGIAHDFNNLLMGIQGCASLMDADMEASHPHNEHLQSIVKYVNSASDLTRQLLGFARDGKYEVKPVDANELVISSSAMFGRTRKEVRIHLKPSARPSVVEVDRGQIEQVLLNMYVNAWQAMPEGGDLYLQVQSVALDESYCAPHEIEPGKYIRISLTDTGIGMEDAVLQRVFDPFFTTKSKSRGTGLGLASAYGIVKNHGGMIHVSSRPGHGSTFDIYLPQSHSQAAAERHVDKGILMGAETVLLVDDEEMILKVGQGMLERLGYRVMVAANGIDALEMVKSRGGEIDLVILDLVMPGMTGDKAFDRMRALRPTLPVLLASGYAVSGKAAEVLDRGCNGFIQKPFTLAELSWKIREILDEAGASAR